MKTQTILLLAVGLSLCSSAAVGQKTTQLHGCNPNGNLFNLAPLVNASLHGQANESVALLAGRGGNGADLVVGAALDYRQLVEFDGFPNDVYYVQRDNSSCAADFDGGLPAIGQFLSLTGYPQVVADPAHDAFFIADIRFQTSPDVSAVGIVKSTAANLLNATNCPNGTQTNPATCWNIGGVANQVPLNTFLFNPSIAVDQRTQGTGAGDVYVTTTQSDHNTNAQPQISLTACTNSTLNCGSSVIISGADPAAQYSSVQVRPDGGITVSYTNIVGSGTTTVYDIKFVNCTPQGAPKAPSCSAPILVTAEMNPGVIVPGDEWNSTDAAFPRHVNRLESDGKTVTTFLIYDQCATTLYSPPQVELDCPKTQVAMTVTQDGGKMWSPVQTISKNPGQQFLGTLALDASTGTVNIAYYSSQMDPLKLRTQVFLAQIPLGQTTVGTITQITTLLYDGPTGFLTFQGDHLACCDYIGVAAAGTGQAGQSRAYIHFTGAVAGSFNGQDFPIYTNTLTRFDY
jgi:hypothetical protein